jgi:hypothetical protein
MSFVFGPFRLSPMRRLLAESDKPVRLGSRAFDILVAPLERPCEQGGWLTLAASRVDLDLCQRRCRIKEAIIMIIMDGLYPFGSRQA